MKRHIWAGAMAAALALAASAHAATVTYNTNLVVNGDAETGDTTGWQSNGVGIIAADPNGTIDEFSFWAGTGNAASETLRQTVDLSMAASGIDAGMIGFDFSAALQNRFLSGVLDRVVLTLSFLDNSSAILGSSFSFEDSSNPTGVYDFDFVSMIGVIPAGTRAVLVELDFSRSGFSSTDAFADDIFFALTNNSDAVPLPGAALFLLTGLGALLTRRSMTVAS